MQSLGLYKLKILRLRFVDLATQVVRLETTLSPELASGLITEAGFPVSH